MLIVQKQRFALYISGLKFANTTIMRLYKAKIISLGVLLFLLGLMQLFTFSSPTEQDKFQGEFNKHYRIFSINLPQNIDFAGERLPMHDFEVRERLDKELLVNTYWQSNTLLMLKKANRYFPAIERSLKKHGIPEDFKYLCLAESGLSIVTSPAGAQGYWQFMEETGKKFGLEITEEIDERNHLEKATEAACRYLKEAYREFGNWTLVAASYNMGITGLRKQLNNQGVDSYYDLYLNTETSRYVLRLMAIKEICSNPRKYGYYVRKSHLYFEVPTIKVEVDSGISNLADFALKNGTTYKMLKQLNPWLRKPYLTNAEGKKYFIELPKEKNVDLAGHYLTGDSADLEEEFMLEEEPAKPYEEFIMIEYTVEKNEDINDVAKKFNVSVPDVMKWNQMTETYIKKGQKIRILQHR